MSAGETSMRRPTTEKPSEPSSVDEVYFPSPEEFSEARAQTEAMVKKNLYPGDWKIIMGLIGTVTVIDGLALWCVSTWIEFNYIDAGWYMWPLPNATGYLMMGVVIAVTVLMLWSYAVSCLCDAGRPSPSWTPVRHIEGIDPEFDPLSPTHKVRWCDICNAYKPPRTHHCGRCGYCVLRMDHHCMWTANCVGYRNHKAFFLFLMYLSALIWMGVMFPCLRIANVVFFDPDGPLALLFNFIDHAPIMFLLWSCMVLQSYVGVLFGEQCQQLFGNITTLEKRDLVALKACWKENTRVTCVRKRLIWPYTLSSVPHNMSFLWHDGYFMALFPTIPPMDMNTATHFEMCPEFVDAMRDESSKSS
eukprot:CAMPEP_0119120640 /NCGR_PEP_ID=MMETSP1310-20130426/1593_1 /TAXON_ID=464262 /ORGANISM="Genus nov. species nov., Strain RCC2339" /LENGTH=359 /DNA_ID=CAMNT_0007110129 /DNA_START=40 /DNA_END=1116 /DNA_ORIENTATION=-